MSSKEDNFISILAAFIIHLCMMFVYKVVFKDNVAIAAHKSVYLKHGDVSFDENNTVNWYAVECENEEIAKEIAEKTVKNFWQKKRTGL